MSRPATQYARPLYKWTYCRQCLRGAAQSRTYTSAQEQALRTQSVEDRIKQLGGREQLNKHFPRMKDLGKISNLKDVDIARDIAHLDPDATDRKQLLRVLGRVQSIRSFGRLAFIDVKCWNDQELQVTVNMSEVQTSKLPSGENPWRIVELIRRGDWISAMGHAHRTRRGEYSLLAQSVPQKISPSLRDIPLQLTGPEFRMRNRHVEHIVNPQTQKVIRLRATIMQVMRRYLDSNSFIEVNTPLLVAGAGGAIARPFETVATEFSDLKLNLRVAPELFLKRLIVGNFSRVYELGPAFRNEGIDATHNPEFTICEYYETMASLEQLMRRTHQLFLMISKDIKEADLGSGLLPSSGHAGASDPINWNQSYRVLEFVPSIQSSIQQQIPNWEFPDLSDYETALKSLSSTFEQLGIPWPNEPTLVRLLDLLSSKLLEPQCVQPTWITHYPEIMSPLAKSFMYESRNGTRHVLSARAELFIAGREYVNCYEEENSPVEQRRKFQEQIERRKVSAATADREAPMETHQVVDENYLEALEWGMPPTGGWGCGVDRIVMLFAGADRIADVLPFGNLRNVVGLGSDMLRKRELKLEKHVL